MSMKRCIKCGTVDEYHDADNRCRHCKGALVKPRSKGPDILTKIAWNACDKCFGIGYYSCQRAVDAGNFAIVDSTCNVWQELTE